MWRPFLFLFLFLFGPKGLSRSSSLERLYPPLCVGTCVVSTVRVEGRRQPTRVLFVFAYLPKPVPSVERTARGPFRRSAPHRPDGRLPFTEPAPQTRKPTNRVQTRRSPVTTLCILRYLHPPGPSRTDTQDPTLTNG